MKKLRWLIPSPVVLIGWVGMNIWTWGHHLEAVVFVGLFLLLDFVEFIDRTGG